MSSLYIAEYSCIFVPGLLQTTFGLTLLRVRAVCAVVGWGGGWQVCRGRDRSRGDASRCWRRGDRAGVLRLLGRCSARLVRSCHFAKTGSGRRCVFSAAFLSYVSQLPWCVYFIVLTKESVVLWGFQAHPLTIEHVRLPLRTLVRHSVA